MYIHIFHLSYHHNIICFEFITAIFGCHIKHAELIAISWWTTSWSPRILFVSMVSWPPSRMVALEQLNSSLLLGDLWDLHHMPLMRAGGLLLYLYDLVSLASNENTHYCMIRNSSMIHKWPTAHHLEQQKVTPTGNDFPRICFRVKVKRSSDWTPVLGDVPSRRQDRSA